MPGFEPPVVYWTPSISVAGVTFYTGDKLPKWKGDLFVGGLRTGEVPGTGHLDRVLLNDKMEELRRESLLVDLHQRIRDVKQGPDGFLYVATDEAAGRDSPNRTCAMTGWGEGRFRYARNPPAVLRNPGGNCRRATTGQPAAARHCAFR